MDSVYKMLLLFLLIMVYALSLISGISNETPKKIPSYMKSVEISEADKQIENIRSKINDVINAIDDVRYNFDYKDIKKLIKQVVKQINMLTDEVKIFLNIADRLIKRVERELGAIKFRIIVKNTKRELTLLPRLYFTEKHERRASD